MEKLEVRAGTEKWNEGYDGQVHSNITENQSTIGEKVLTLGENLPTEKELLGKESISKTRREVKEEGDVDGKKKENEESEARRRWRGACKLALHTNSGAGALQTNLGYGAKKLSLPEIRPDSGKQTLDGPVRRIFTGSCKLGMHTDKANNGDASELGAFDPSRADTNTSRSRPCNFGMHTTLVEVNNSNSDPGNFSKMTPTTKNEAPVRKTSDPGYYSKAPPTTERKTSDPGPHSKITTLTTTENETTMRKKWKNACKLVLHTNSLTSKKEKEEEEVFGMHTRPARLAPKIQIEEADVDEADSLEPGQEEEKADGSLSSGGKTGRCRLTLHCGEDDQEVTPGALLSISLKKQGQVFGIFCN